MLDVTVEDQSWAIIALLAFYSVKPGEILACDVSDLHIDSDGATLHFRPMEGAGRRPYLILFPELTERLVRLTAGRRRNDPLFVSNKGNRMGRGSVQGFINTASRRANLGYFATAKMLEYTLPATAISQGFSFVGLLRAVGIIQPRQFVRWLATSAAVPGETNASLRMARLVLSPPDDFENWLLHIDAQLNETDLPEPFAVMAAGAVFERYLRALCIGLNLPVSKDPKAGKMSAYVHQLRDNGHTMPSEDRIAEKIGINRNDAAHGNFEALVDVSARKIVEDVREFMANHPLPTTRA
ncbi:hypothetical protein JCM10369A_44200 [Nocardioides pyridinolyticus]